MISTVNEKIQEIEEALINNDLNKANNLANDLVSMYPNENFSRKVFMKVNKLIDKELKEKIQRTIKESAPLWKEAKYRELLIIYSRLYNSMPDYPRLEEKITELRNLVDNMSAENAEEFIKKSLQTIKKLYSQKDYKAVIIACQEFLKFDPTSTLVDEIYKKARNKFVKEKIKHGLLLIDKKAYKEALGYFEQLFRIAPENTKIKKSILRLQDLLNYEEVIHKASLVKDKYKIVKALLSEKKYDDVLRNCSQVLLIDSKQSKAQRIINRINQKLRKIIELEVVEQLLRSQRILKAEFASGKTDIVKI